MSQLNQIQVKYQAIEDRLLMRINSKASHEYSLWLTRRYTQLLWKVLLELLHDNKSVQNVENAQVKKSILSFQHEKAVAKTQYGKDFNQSDQTQHPLGDGPLLLASIGIVKRKNGLKAIAMKPEHGQGIELSVDDQLVHSLCGLIKQAVQVANWHLEMRQLNIPSNQPMASRTIN